MRKRLSLCLLVAGSFLAGALYVGIPVGAGPVDQPSTGDTNGDGLVDMSDAIYLLSHLFNGGPPPAACADSPELVERVEQLESGFEALVATMGEKLDRIAVATEANGRALEMVAAATQGTNEALSGGVSVVVSEPCEDRADQFVDNGDGTVTDICTGLMWTQLNVDVNGDGTSSGDFVDWTRAVQACDELEFQGFDDWRLPTNDELESIRRQGRDPAIPSAFGASKHLYWTSDEDRQKPDSNAMAVWFQGIDLNSSSRPKIDNHGVRAVRDAD